MLSQQATADDIIAPSISIPTKGDEMIQRESIPSTIPTKVTARKMVKARPPKDPAKYQALFLQIPSTIRQQLTSKSRVWLSPNAVRELRDGFGEEVGSDACNSSTVLKEIGPEFGKEVGFGSHTLSIDLRAVRNVLGAELGPVEGIFRVEVRAVGGVFDADTGPGARTSPFVTNADGTADVRPEA